MEITDSFAYHYLSRHSVEDKIKTSPERNLRFIVVIPSFDEPGLIQSLQSVRLCARPASAVEIIVVVNSPANADRVIIEQNQKSIRDASLWAKQFKETGFSCHILDEAELPAREAGPGLARKIGMDQAVLRFAKLNRPDGIIISLDADSLCRPDYLQAIERCFDRYPDTIGATIYFEHPLAGEEFPPVVYNAIAEYELHLRYTISALRSIRFPYAYHTIGSCFCVTASAYVNQGGMNKRKGGEDFYFLQKIIPLGRFREINDTCVYPSPRPSVRAPFGTGTVITKFSEGKINQVETYHPGSFETLKELFSDPSEWFRLTRSEIDEKISRLPETVREYTGTEFQKKIIEINNNSSSPDTFTKRFYQWFNMFRVIKYLNFVNKKHFSKIPVRQAATEFLQNSGFEPSGDIETEKTGSTSFPSIVMEKPGHRSFRDMNTTELLEYFRILQKGRASLHL